LVEDVSTSSSGRDLAEIALAVPIVLSSLRVSNFKLEEEGNTALLLLLPVLFAETTVLWLASGSGCLLVVAVASSLICGERFAVDYFLVEDNDAYLP